MRTDYFGLNNGDYIIKCKRMFPDNGNVSEIILGVHGFGGDMESSALEKLAKEMTERGAGVVCFDFPAHGSSEADSEKLTAENCKRDLLCAADFCRDKYPEAKKSVFATSFGGYITLLCADSLAEFRLILRAPAVTMAEHILLDILGLSEEEYRKAGFVELSFDRTIKIPFSFYESLTRNRVINRTFSQQALIIHGDCDDIVPRADILEFCKNNPQMKLFNVAGADHRFKKAGELDTVVLAAREYIEQ